jgi:hypothetical protein
LFWEKMVSLLPTVTSVSGINADAGPAASITTSDNSRPIRTARGLRRIGPPLDRQRPVLLYQTNDPGGMPVTPYFGMSSLGGLEVAEVARIVGRRPGMARVLAHRGRMRLARRVEAAGLARGVTR